MKFVLALLGLVCLVALAQGAEERPEEVDGYPVEADLAPAESVYGYRRYGYGGYYRAPYYGGWRYGRSYGYPRYRGYYW
ncbi:unnamed protein product [Darwinula stevensoni]|uniref:Uncharacterized protein n=1 Tax=Darwinula stevensoni TaxID=69355 RepID=A0A7R8XCP5_9CRUS|nr:unnamed protein product [Darwinula stevensoni]CAG0893551.1 unnamed protein product [Darwinula stevensoni]